MSHPPSYEFDAPRFVEFNDEEEETINKDGYFVEARRPGRRSRQSILPLDGQEETEALKHIQNALNNKQPRQSLALPVVNAPSSDQVMETPDEDAPLVNSMTEIQSVPKSSEDTFDVEAMDNFERPATFRSVEPVKELVEEKKSEVKVPNVMIGARRIENRLSASDRRTSGYDPRSRHPSPKPLTRVRPNGEVITLAQQQQNEADPEAGLLDFSAKPIEQRRSSINRPRSLSSVMGQTDAALRSTSTTTANIQPMFRGSWMAQVAEPRSVTRLFVPSVTQEQTGSVRDIQKSTSEAEAELNEVQDVAQEDDTETKSEMLPAEKHHVVHNESVQMEPESEAVIVPTLANNVENKDSMMSESIRRPIRTLLTTSQRVSTATMDTSVLSTASKDGYHGGYRVRDGTTTGTRQVPGYMTPTESHKGKQRDKVVAASPRAMTPPPTSRVPHTPTQPREFQLATSTRRRSNSGQLKSSTSMELLKLREQREKMAEKKRLEEEQLARIQRSTTRSAVSHRPTMTAPEPFSFDSNTQKYVKQHVHVHEFHSMAELSNSILLRTTPVPHERPSSPHPAVQPQAPVLRSDSRVRGSIYKTSEEMELERIKAEKELERRRKEQNRFLMERSLNSSQSIIKADTKPLTEPEPFALKSQSRHERAQEEIRRRQEQEERKLKAMRTQFKAKPVPPQIHVRAPSPRPVVSHELTVPVAPSCVERATVAEQLRLNKLEEEERERAKQREFHAKPLPRTTYEPGFLPIPASTPMVAPQSPSLRTNQRAEKWQETGQQKREQEEREAAERAEEARRRAEQEQEEIRKEREARVFKARPVPRTSLTRTVMDDTSFNGSIPDLDKKREFQYVSSASKGLGGGAARVPMKVLSN